RSAASEPLSVTTTLAPLAARSLLMAAPRPEPPPVTNAPLSVTCAVTPILLPWGVGGAASESRPDPLPAFSSAAVIPAALPSTPIIHLQAEYTATWAVRCVSGVVRGRVHWSAAAWSVAASSHHPARCRRRSR